jgi:nucleoside kinase
VAGRPGTRQLLVAGHVNVDHFLSVARIPGPDRTAPVVAERLELGGTATNVARSARRCGVSVGLLGSVGDGFPPPFRATLAREGIDLRGLTTVAGAPTPCCTIVEDRRGRTRTLIQQGPMGDSAPHPLPGPWWRAYRWLHLGTGSPAHYLRLAREARRGHRQVALDPAQEIFYRWDRATFRRILPLAEILFGNRAEIDRAAAWAGARGVPSLLEQVPLVVRTEGPEGATAFFRGGTAHAPGRRPRRVRTFVGAGDAFRGGFYGGWFAGAPLADCLVAGNRAALDRIETGR